MNFLCYTKKEAYDIKKKYCLEGKEVIIVPLKNSVILNGKIIKYEVRVIG